MRNLMLLAGVAALAVSVPAVAKENDRGRGNGRPAASAQHKGQGHGRAERARGRDQARAQARSPGRERRADRLDRRERRVERAIQQERRQVRQARAQDRRVERRQQAQRQPQRRQQLVREDRRDWQRWSERRLAVRDRDRVRVDWRDVRPRRTAARGHCPPGLARQNRWCMPPGQLRQIRRAQLIGQRLPVARVSYNIPDRYRYRFADGDRWFYRYDDAGYVYRLDRRTMIVNSIIPLYGSGLTIGEPMPIGYDIYNLPMAYRSYYPDSSDYYYRYDRGAIYQVDAETRLVEGIVALLTGGVGGLGGLGVGDPLPSGYDVYNVPFAYRDTYYDRDDAWYRYADGSIYQIDPQTRLIESIISTLV